MQITLTKSLNSFFYFCRLINPTLQMQIRFFPPFIYIAYLRNVTFW